MPRTPPHSSSVYFLLAGPQGINELAQSPGFFPQGHAHPAVASGDLWGQGVLEAALGLLADLGLAMFGVLIHFAKIAFHSHGDR